MRSACRNDADNTYRIVTDKIPENLRGDFNQIKVKEQPVAFVAIKGMYVAKATETAPMQEGDLRLARAGREIPKNKTHRRHTLLQPTISTIVSGR